MRVPSTPVFTYTAALVLTAAAQLLRWELDPWLGDAQPLSLLFGAVALAVWWGGVGPAVVVTALGYFTSDYLFIPPRGEFAIIDVQELVSLVTYLVSCSIIVGFGHGLREARRRSQEYARVLEAQKAELELVERRKDQFLATLAHELRNPVSPILNSVEALRYAPSPAAAAGLCDVIERQARHITRLVDDLFDLSRIASGRLRLHVERLELASALTCAIEMARPPLERRAQALYVSISSEPIFIDGDFNRLVQVFSNLLINAARYTPEEGEVSLTAWREGATAIVSIRDNGVGIPAEMLSRIFELYVQVDRAAEESRPGLGIGLTLARRLLNLHGASIEAHSEGSGKGSEFIVRLPARPMNTPGAHIPTCNRENA